MSNDDQDLDLLRKIAPMFGYRPDIMAAEIIKLEDKLSKIEELVFLGSIAGDHHKAWIIDQILRIVTGDNYEQWVKEFEDGEDGPHTYEWDVGIAP